MRHESSKFDNQRYAVPARMSSMKAYIVKQRAKGLNARQIMTKISQSDVDWKACCTYNYVCSVISRYDRYRRENGGNVVVTRRYSDRIDKFKKTLELHKQGMKYRQIAKAVGVSDSTAYFYILRHENGYTLNKDNEWVDADGDKVNSVVLTSLRRRIEIKSLDWRNEDLNTIVKILGVSHEAAISTAVSHYKDYLLGKQASLKSVDDVSN